MNPPVIKVFIFQYPSPLAGAWFDIDSTTEWDEITEQMESLGYSGEEYGCADTDHALANCFLTGESLDLKALTSCLADIEFHRLDPNAVTAFINCYGEWDVDAFLDAYQGEAESEAAFTQDLVEECYPEIESLPPFIHIDWEATARDLFISDFYMEDGHVFRHV